MNVFLNSDDENKKIGFWFLLQISSGRPIIGTRTTVQADFLTFSEVRVDMAAAGLGECSCFKLSAISEHNHPDFLIGGALLQELEFTVSLFRMMVHLCQAITGSTQSTTQCVLM